MTQLAQVFNSTDTQELLAAASVDFTQKAPVSKYKKNRSEGAPKKPGSAYNCFLSSRSKVGVCACLVGCVHVGGDRCAARPNRGGCFACAPIRGCTHTSSRKRCEVPARPCVTHTTPPHDVVAPQITIHIPLIDRRKSRRRAGTTKD